ncbi:DnaJ domain-containing protein [Phycisphaeraceae bacterium D3-23]
MGFWPGKSKQPGDADWRNRRAERFGTASVKCQLGSVVDMSATGMRLLCDKKPPVAVGNVYATKISFDDGAMPLQVQVRWIKRRGLRQFELGLQFVALKSGADRVLEAVARFGMASAAKSAKETSAGGKPGVKNSRASKRPHLSTDLPDYFAVMNLKRDATPQQIKVSYRKLAVALHPDRCDAPDAMEKFERLHEAYEVLSDSKRRETYLEMTG